MEHRPKSSQVTAHWAIKNLDESTFRTAVTPFDSLPHGSGTPNRWALNRRAARKPSCRDTRFDYRFAHVSYDRSCIPSSSAVASAEGCNLRIIFGERQRPRLVRLPHRSRCWTNVRPRLSGIPIDSSQSEMPSAACGDEEEEVPGGRGLRCRPSVCVRRLQGIRPKRRGSIPGSLRRGVRIVCARPYVCRPRPDGGRLMVIHRYPVYSVFYREFDRFWLLAGIIPTVQDPDSIQALLVIREIKETEE